MKNEKYVFFLRFWLLWIENIILSALGKDNDSCLSIYLSIYLSIDLLMKRSQNRIEEDFLGFNTLKDMLFISRFIYKWFSLDLIWFKNRIYNILFVIYTYIYITSPKIGATPWNTVSDNLFFDIIINYWWYIYICVCALCHKSLDGTPSFKMSAYL